MPDEVTPVVTPTPVTAPVEAAQPAPAAAAPVVTPAPEVSQTPVVEAPNTEGTKAPETVLGEALVKPAEVKPAEEVKPVTAEPVENKTPESKSDEPAPLPVYDPFVLPEGVTLDKERSDKFTGILGELERTGKVDHALVQQFGQKAVDFHLEEVKRVTEEIQDFYQKTWEKQKTDWKDQFLKDPEMGGNRFQTTIDSALTFIRTHGGTPEQQTEFRNLMEESGLGNHPAMIRLLANAGRAMSEGRPLAAQKPVPATKSRIETMYGKSA